MTDPSEIVNTIHRMKWQHIEHGGEPTKITMSIKTYYTMLKAVQNMVIVHKEPKKQTICGLEIEVRDDVADDTLFIVS